MRQLSECVRATHAFADGFDLTLLPDAVHTETSLDQLDSAAAAAEAADQHKEDEGEDDFEEAEMPFPEPEDRATLLSDLLGLAAEAETAAMLQQGMSHLDMLAIHCWGCCHASIYQ